ncbi:MAG: hypothetical protein ACREBC_09515 [Pyrinomonadaceae bacterium]
MKAGPKDRWAPSRAMLIARALVSTIVALSFLATLLTFALASADEPGLMACCIGKPGHESGLCRTGLLVSAEQSQLDSTISSSQEPALQESRSRDVTEVKASEKGGEHCSLHAQLTSENTEGLQAASEPETVSTLNEDPTTTSPETTEFRPEPGSASNETGLGNIHALSSPCPMECGACSVSNTRRPRPREQVIVAFEQIPRLLSDRRYLSGTGREIRTRHAKFLQLHPRAPPTPLV